MAFLRLVQFTLTPASASQAATMASDLIPAIKQQPGCAAAVFFGGGADGVCGLSVQWDTQENADAAAAVIGPRLEKYLAGNTLSPPDINVYPVLAD